MRKYFLIGIMLISTGANCQQIEGGVYWDLAKARENISDCTVLLQERSKLERFAASVCKLTNLVYLDYANNLIDSVSQCIGSLPQLQYLYLSGNEIVKFPEGICSSKSLKLLALDNNKIPNVPETIGQLTTLEYLFLCFNDITSLPESFGNLTNLRVLEIQGNFKLKTLPASFSNLKNLEVLILEGANFENLETHIVHFKKLKVLSLHVMPGMTEERKNGIKALLPPGCLFNPTGEEEDAAGINRGYRMQKF